ncbi:MAG: aminoglycoside phosphotransferase [Alphaproteobacteria bacterium]|nr:aminoglycoside phosphotransferase [Alphaproteobacteria bacterium]
MSAGNDGDRRKAIEAQLAAWSWSSALIAPLAADASFRRYWRVSCNGKAAVLMDAPPQQEDVRPFVAVARHLAALGLSAPTVLAVAEDAGFVLLEDLGEQKFTPLLANGFDAMLLYGAAVDLLAELRQSPPPSFVPAYDQARLLAEARLLIDWYLPAVTGHETSDDVAALFVEAWTKVLAPVARERSVLVLRDYHADNLMWLPARHGLKRVGLLDFQDGVAGHPAYDLVSLLEDARRDVECELAEKMILRYLAHSHDDVSSFRAAYAILGAQRNTKIVGIFSRLSRRDGKVHYLDMIPRVFGYLDRDLSHPALAPVRAWFARHLPAALRARRPDGAGFFPARDVE